MNASIDMANTTNVFLCVMRELFMSRSILTLSCFSLCLSLHLALTFSRSHFTFLLCRQMVLAISNGENPKFHLFLCYSMLIRKRFEHVILYCHVHICRMSFQFTALSNVCIVFHPFGIPKIAENETENERAENFCLGFIINDIVFARSRARPCFYQMSKSIHVHHTIAK